jgi:ELWxxDGT repeat protein
MKKYLLTLSLFIYLFVFSAKAQIIELVKQVHPSGSAYPTFLTVANNKLFFTASDNVNFQKLWVSSGTPATTQFIGPPGSVIGSLRNLVSFNNKLFFQCDDGISGPELWTSDGTVAGTVLFKDLYPGPTGSYPQYFTVANNKLFFMGGGVNGERRIYVSDGTPAGTFIVRDNYSDVLNGQNDFPVMNGNIYFRGDNGTGSGSGLWKSDGTVAGTVVVKGDIIPGTLGANYAVLNNKLYFNCFDYTNGSELWVTDGTNAGTYMVINLATDGGGVLYSGAPNYFTVFNSKLYFSATDDAHGNELFESDGTAGGTLLVKDFLPGTASSVPSGIAICNGALYILSATNQLWKSNGTTSGTQFVKNVSSYNRFAAVWNNKAYIVSFSDNDVWESDGTVAGTRLMTATNTTNPITSSGGDPAFTQYNSGLYFSGFCSGVTTAGFQPVRLSTGLPPVTTYSFTGSGNWSNPANWSGGIVPPSTLPSGSNIVITGNCILDVTQNVQSGASVTVATGGSLLILGSLTTM